MALSSVETKRRRIGTIPRSVIPVDITREILLRLPVRSLVSFRRVCKLWLSIIRDPHFIQSHLDHSINTRLPSILFVPCRTNNVVDIARLDADEHLEKSDAEPYFSSPGAMVKGSCNGLLCIVGKDDKTVRVVNPSTGESLTPPERTKSNPSCFFSTIVYLGFNPVTKEYKLVNFFGDRKIRKAKGMWVGCEVYTLGTSSWREIGRFDYRPAGHVLVSAKGSMYWNTVMKGVSLLRFDLQSEEFDPMSTINFDQFYVKRSHYDDIFCMLVDLQGSVGILVYPCFMTGEEMPRTDLWVLNDDEHSWTRKYSVIYPWRFDYMPMPLLINKDKLLVHVQKSREWVTCSNLPRYRDYHCHLQYHHLSIGEDEQGNDNQRSIEEVKIDQYCKFRTFVHIESLVPLPNVPAQTSATQALIPVVPPTIRSCTHLESL